MSEVRLAYIAGLSAHRHASHPVSHHTLYSMDCRNSRVNIWSNVNQFHDTSVFICSQLRHQGGGGAMGSFPPVGGLAPPPPEKKMAKISLGKFLDFAPSESHFAPSMPNKKKNSGAAAATVCSSDIKVRIALLFQSSTEFSNILSFVRISYSKSAVILLFIYLTLRSCCPGYWYCQCRR